MTGGGAKLAPPLKGRVKWCLQLHGEQLSILAAYIARSKHGYGKDYKVPPNRKLFSENCEWFCEHFHHYSNKYLNELAFIDLCEHSYEYLDELDEHVHAHSFLQICIWISK